MFLTYFGFTDNFDNFYWFLNEGVTWIFPYSLIGSFIAFLLLLMEYVGYVLSTADHRVAASTRGQQVSSRLQLVLLGLFDHCQHSVQ